MSKYEEFIKKNKKVGNFGIKYLDDKLSGILASDLVLIGARSGCVDKDTEFFSQNGWKKISDYKDDDKVLQFDTDSEKAELIYPEEYICNPCYKFYRFKNKFGLDMMLSGEHDVLYLSDKGNYLKSSAEDIAKRYLLNKNGFTQRIQTTFYFSGKGINLSDIELKLMIAIIADGSFPKGRKGTVVFHLKKERKKQELVSLLKEYGCKYRFYERKDGYHDISFKAPFEEKIFKKYWYKCSKDQLQIIFDNIFKWDGSIDKKGRRRFFTTVKSNADFIQFVFSSLGFRGGLSNQDRRGRKRSINGKYYTTKSIDYVVTASDNRYTTVSDPRGCKNSIEIIKSNENKYCFTVPSSNLVLRRNNFIFVTGNSGKSTISNIIAMANKSKKVALFSLENFDGDDYMKECYYYYMRITKRYDIKMREFVSGQLRLDDEALKEAETKAEAKLDHLKIINRQNGYSLKQLKDDMISCVVNDGVNLIILDHLDYLDKVDERTSDVMHISEIMRTIREIQDAFDCAVVAISHLRKPSTSAKNMPVVPSMDEFIGSSNKVKESTVVIMFAPDDESNENGAKTQEDYVKSTYCCVRKLRSGGIDNTTARLYYNMRRGQYANKHDLFRINYSGTKIEEVL